MINSMRMLSCFHYAFTFSIALLNVHTLFSLFFFFNDTAPPEIYTLSLPDALPISLGGEPTSDGAADASARSGHECDLVLELEVHGRPPVRSLLPRARKRRHVRLVEIGEPVQRAGHPPREGLEVEPERPPAHPTAPLLQERSRAAEVAVRQVLVAHRDLDQTLQRLLRFATRPRPLRLEQPVDLEVEPSVVERRRRVERRGERRLRARERQPR